MGYKVSIKEIGLPQQFTLYDGNDKAKADLIKDTFLLSTRYTDHLYIQFEVTEVK